VCEVFGLTKKLKNLISLFENGRDFLGAEDISKGKGQKNPSNSNKNKKLESIFGKKIYIQKWGKIYILRDRKKNN
jgi:hypothetical protein